jgi:hypothetical protein
MKTAKIKASEKEIKQRENEPDSFGSTSNKSCLPLKRPSANFATIIYLSHITTMTITNFFVAFQTSYMIVLARSIACSPYCSV